MIFSHKRLQECEFQINLAKNLMDELLVKVAVLRMKVNELEKNQKNQLITHDIQFHAPFGAKLSFTFVNSDGTPNGGFCNDIDSLPRLVDMIREMGGTALVIKDETVYLKITKSSVKHELPEKE